MPEGEWIAIEKLQAQFLAALSVSVSGVLRFNHSGHSLQAKDRICPSLVAFAHSI